MLNVKSFSKDSFALTTSILCLGHFFVDLMLGIWPVFKTLAHLDLAIAGLIAGLSAFIGEGLQVVFGSLSDRGYRKILILSGILLTACSTLFAYTESYYLLFVFYFITCLGSGAFHPSGAGLMGSLTEERKGLFISIFVASGTLGMAVSQIIFTQTLSFFQGHVTVLVFFPLVIVSTALLLSFDAKDETTAAQSGKKHLKDFFNLFRRQDLVWLYVTQLCNATIFWGVVFLIPDVLIARGYESWVCFGGGHLCFILGSATIMVLGGFLTDFYSPRSVIIAVTSAGGLLYYFFLFNPLLSDVSVLIVLFGLGALIGTINPIVIAFGTRLFPDNPSVVSAFLMGMVWCLAECLGPGGGGALTKLFSEDAPAKALGILGVFFGMGLVAALQLPKAVEERKEAVDYASQTDFLT